MIEYIEHEDLNSLIFFISVRIIIILACWLFMIFGNIIDFWSGVSTAKAIGEKVITHGYRRTIIKIGDYVKVMLFALMFDLLGMTLPPSILPYQFPFITMLTTIAVLIIEVRSVLENHKRKKAHAADVPDVIKEIVHAATTDQAKQIVSRLKQEFA